MIRRLCALAGAVVERVRVDTAIVLAMLATLMAHPHAVIGFIADLLGLP